MSQALRLSAAVLAAADQLSSRLVGGDASSVEEVPSKGSKAGHYLIQIDEGDDQITITVPHTAAQSFADRVGEMSGASASTAGSSSGAVGSNGSSNYHADGDAMSDEF